VLLSSIQTSVPLACRCLAETNARREARRAARGRGTAERCHKRLQASLRSSRKRDQQKRLPTIGHQCFWTSSSSTNEKTGVITSWLIEAERVSSEIKDRFDIAKSRAYKEALSYSFAIFLKIPSRNRKINWDFV
jgi:hypothetical protein